MREDAADQFAAYIMLQFGKEQAHRLITGAAYSYKNYVQRAEVTAPLAAFSDAHAPPAQRFYNMLCLAYGADSTLFADVVDKGYLAEGAGQELQTRIRSGCVRVSGSHRSSSGPAAGKTGVGQDMAARCQSAFGREIELSHPRSILLGIIVGDRCRTAADVI